MKNSTNRILQVVKWTCSFAVLLLAVSLCPTAFAQPVFIDTGFNSNNPPTPGPNDLYQTNALNTVTSTTGISYRTDSQAGAGVTFVTLTAGPGASYAVTNVMIKTSALASDYGTSGGGSGTPTNMNQAYVLSFYQIAGTNGANGISTNTTLIASVISSNGLVTTPGDWMSFSNFAVFLNPGTTNAFTLHRLPWENGGGAYISSSGGETNLEGEGWMNLLVVTNNIGGTGATHYFGTGSGNTGTNNFYNGLPIGITNTVSNTIGTFNGVGTNLTAAIPWTNASSVFSIGINTGFLPGIFAAQPLSSVVVTPGVATATMTAIGGGSYNASYGIGGYWMLTNSTYPSGQILANAYEATATIATSTTTSAVGAPGATVASTLWISNYTTADAGSYVFIITNSPDGVTLLSSASTVATLSFTGVPPNSYAAAVISNGYGAIGYYPLNETIDPSTATVVAYDLIGAFNGIYGPSANNGGGNAAEAGVATLVGYGPVPAPGTGAAPLSGLPTQGALFTRAGSNLNDVVCIPNGPTNTDQAAGVVNSTNDTIVAWIFDNTFTEPNQPGIFYYRNNDANLNGIGLNLGNGANTIGYQWDANASTTWNYAGQHIYSNTWSMVALVINPSTTIEYVCATNLGIVQQTQVNANVWQPLGGHADIGLEDYGPNGFQGYISSIAIFTNSLSPGQIETLFAAGEGGPGLPVILSNNLPPSFPVALGASSSVLSMAGYGGTNSGAYWQYSNSTTLSQSPGTQGWVVVGPGNSDFQGSAAVSNGVAWSGVLQATNFQNADVAAYEFVVTNSLGAVTSSVVSLIPATGYLAYIETNALSLGLMSFLPLNETNDPSGPGGTTPTVIAYDLYGGYNGLYGTNSRDGGTNKGSHLPPVVGPGLQGFLGLPTNGALGVTNLPALNHSYVDFAAGTGPTLPNSGPGEYNTTLMAWVYPTEAMTSGNYAGQDGIIMNNGTGAPLGIEVSQGGGAPPNLGYTWNNNNNWGYNSGLAATSGTWNLLAMVIAATGTEFYVANTNVGILSATNNGSQGSSAPVANNGTYEQWGNVETRIGGNNRGGNDNYSGYYSSVAIFSNALTAAQIGALYVEGLTGSQAPYIVTNVSPALLQDQYIAGAAGSNITATALGGANGGGYWQVFTGGNWVPLSSASGDFSASVQTTVTSGAAQAGALNILNFQSRDAGSYRLIFTNAAGAATSSVVTLSLASASSGFASQVANPANGYGTVAFWPLNETADPSGGMSGNPAIAFDIVGGFNGLYGTNARDGGSNVQSKLAAVAGPGSTNYGLIGLPTQGALGVTNASAYANSFVTTSATPTFPPTGTNTIANTTNATILGWIYPNNAAQNGAAGLFMAQNGGPGNAGLQYANAVNCLGYHWDNNSANTYNDNGPLIVPFMWNMVALVINPATSILYVGNTSNGLVSATQTIANTYQSWGFPVQIGTDTSSAIPGRNIDGLLSSFAMFTNSLSAGALESLFAYGVSNVSVIPPIINSNAPAQFATNYLVANGYSSSVAVTAYGGTNSGAYWLFNNGGGWAPATSADLTTPTAVAGATLLTGTLTITNFTAANDAGSYALVVTNSAGSATSGVVVLAPYTPVAGSFASQVVSAGAIAFWPLNEVSDASTRTAVAYDIIGGFNGLYGTNAQTGASNTFNQLRAVSGPTAPAWAGFPASNGALGDRQSVPANPFTYVTTTGTPTFPTGAGSTNATLLAWVYPNIPVESNTTAVFMTRSGQLGSTNTAGIQYYGNSLGYHWNNDAAVENTYASALAIPSNTWSMIALVITPTNNYFYVASTNYGLVAAVQLMTNLATYAPTNTYEGWGGGAFIGSDPGNSPGDNFNGLISSVAMFSNALSVTQIETLFDSGLAKDSQLPFITQNPPSYEVLAGVNANLPASADPGNPLPTGASGYWRVSYASGGGWQIVPSAGGLNDITGASVPTNFFLANETNTAAVNGFTNVSTIYTTLSIANVGAADVGSYELVVTNATGAVTSAVATISIFNPQANSFAYAAINGGYGVVAYWPLNETNDPSQGGAIAYEVIGLNNGIYGTNAQSAGVNTALFGTPNYLPPKSPKASGFTGFDGIGSLGSLQSNLNQTYVSTATSPTLRSGTTNATIAAWVYPTMNIEGPNCGVFIERPAGGGNANGIQYGTADTLGYHWDNDNSVTYSYNSGPLIPSNTWSMLAVVISTNTNYFYVANNVNGLTMSAQVMTNGGAVDTNIYQALGLPATIGGDPGTDPARNYGGYIRSVALFSNSLTVAQIETLFNAGAASGAQAPIFTANPLSYQLLPGNSPTAALTASVYGGQPTTAGYWQMSTVPGTWTNLVDDSVHEQGSLSSNATSYTSLLTSTLWLTNITSADVGSYQFVATNGLLISSTSLVATISFLPAPAANTFAAAAVANGAVALWPLSETQDPSGAATNNPTEAFDIISGFNGVYGMNANSGGGNALNSFSPLAGPSNAVNLTGLPASGALGSLQGGLVNTFVTTLASPAIPANSTNLTIVAWVNPQITEVPFTGLVMERAAGQVDGLSYGPDTAGTPPGELGYTWSNYNTFGPGSLIPDNVWSMVAMVITPTNTTLFEANVDGLLPTVVLATNNGVQAFGGALAIGGDPGAGATPSTRSFGGSMSSVAIFTNALSAATLQSMFLDGFDLGNTPPPVIVQQPPSANILLYSNVNVTLTASGYGVPAPGGFPLAGGYWQKSTTPGVWTILTDGNNNGADIAGGADTTLAGVLQAGALQITNVSTLDVGSYELVITNSAGGVTSSVVALSLVPDASEPAAGSFGATALTAGYGAVAFWPLNETIDPSGGGVVAYDVVGGYNGIYGTNADNGGGNSPDGFSAVASPLSAGLTGLTSGGALGSLYNWKPYTFVYMSNTPVFQGLNGPGATAVNNSTNVTLIAWINPQTNMTGNAIGLLAMRTGMFGATRTDTLNYYYGAANTLGYSWDNNSPTTYNYNSGLTIGRSNWSMVALVISPSNAVLYVGNSNFITSATQWMTNGAGIPANDNEPWGGGAAIGGDPKQGSISSSFGGYMADVTMFSNTLSVAQIESLWIAGESNSLTPPPYITIQPASTNIELVVGGVASITASGFGALPAGGYWQKYNGSSWVQVSSADVPAQSVLTSLGGAGGTLQVGLLQFTGFLNSDAGSYELVVTNAGGSATSSVVTINAYNAVAGSFPALAASAGYGAMALWPLDEIVDPSTGISGSAAVAFDVVGGYNGTYGTNADNGGGNAAYTFAPVPGPGSTLPGLPTAGALGVTNLAIYSNSFVTIPISPTFPVGTTNATIVGWFYPSSTAQNNAAGIFIAPNASPGVAGLQYANGNPNLGYHWDNDSATAYNYTGPGITPMTWNMVGLVISPTNSVLYVGKTNALGNYVLTSSTQWMTNGLGIPANIYEAWGQVIRIGTDSQAAFTPPARNVNGYMSSFAMFSGSLSVPQVQGLFAAGVANGNLPPVIVANPANTNLELIVGTSVTVSATAYGGSNAVAYWQTNNGAGGWGIVSSPDASGANATLVNAQLAGNLMIANFQAIDAGSYELVVSNAVGWATSSVVTIQSFSPAIGTFANVIVANQAFGAVALWPLNETVDPSTGITGAPAVAFDVIGGFNGSYGTNADDGGGNAVNGLPALTGPGLAGLPGLPNTGALGVTNAAGLTSSYVTALTSPTFLPGTTNVSIVGWIYPTLTNETANGVPGQNGLLEERNGYNNSGGNNGLIYGGGSGAANTISADWDNGAGPWATGWLNIPSFMWNMVAVVVGPTNLTFYIGNTNQGMTSYTDAITNVYVPWGQGIFIGTDPIGTARNFVGSMSSFAMFSNSLTPQQMQVLFSAGTAEGTNAPFITVQPAFASTEVIAGGTATITSSGYAGTNGGGYWAVNKGSGWVPAYNPADLTGTNAVLNGGNWTGPLSFTNLLGSDAGSYEFILTNTYGSATSQVATVGTYAAPVGSYPAVASSAGYGLVALWPLNETNDPSTGTAVAYDIIGGFNGLYATNAQNGGTNSWILANQPTYILTNNGPEEAGLVGLPSASLGSLQGVAAVPATYVAIPQGPAFPPGTANSSNVSIVVWVYQTLASPATWTGVVKFPDAAPGNSDALAWNINGGGARSPGLVWDNIGVNTSSTLTAPLNTWSMVGVTISPSNYVFYIGNKVNSLTAQTNTATGRNQPLGTNMWIGTDPLDAAVPTRNWPGYLSSVSMFSNTLSYSQMLNLFLAGLSDSTPTPFITQQPAPTNGELAPGTGITLQSAGFVGTGGVGFWQTNNGAGGWGLVNSAYQNNITTSAAYNGASLAVAGSLAITNFKSADAGTYEFVVTNSFGYATSAVVTLSIFSIAPNSFGSYVTNTNYGVMAYWPLNETGDPSLATVTAYDVIGGFNGTYGTNADDGTGNSYDGFAGIPGPGNPAFGGLSGLPAQGALGDTNTIYQAYVTIPQGPTLPAGTTNATLLAWIYPTAAIEYGTGGLQPPGIIYERVGGNANGLCYGNTTNQFGVNWDNNGANDYNEVTGIQIPTDIWSLMCMVISPSNTVFYLANTNIGFVTTSQVVTHEYIPWGNEPSYIGADANNQPGQSFQGYISSAAIFSNSLTAAQVAGLFQGGLGSNTFPPNITMEPPPVVEMLQGGSRTILASGFGGTNANGYWQAYNGSSYVPITSADITGVAGTTTISGVYKQGALVINNFTPGTDAGSYAFILTNGGGSATSSVVTVENVAITAGSFAAGVLSGGMGAVAFWPLSELGDCSTGTNVAFDIIGGFNGLYGTNAQNGDNNTVLESSLWSGDASQPIGGPGNPTNTTPYTGLPTTAYASMNSVPGALITVPVGPSFATNATNATIVMWINPNPALATTNGPLVTNYPMTNIVLLSEDAALGASGNNGVQIDFTNGALQAGYVWDNNATATWSWASGLVIPNNAWSMYAVVVSPSNTVTYLGSLTGGLYAATNNVGNSNVPWGAGLQIGGATAAYGGISNYFNGSISSVAMFSNSLTAGQIETLFGDGYALGNNAPVIVSEPPFTTNSILTNTSYSLLPGAGAAITVVAYTGPGGGAYWQTNNPNTSLWGNLYSPDASGTNVTSSALSLDLVSTLVLSNVNANDACWYQCVITNAGGSITTGVVTVSLATAPAANTYEAVAVGYGAVAFWPLNENVDPSAGPQGGATVPITEAYDIVGGWNGVYALYSLNVAGNYYEEINPPYELGAQGPQSPTFAGFPSDNGAVQTTNNIVTGGTGWTAPPAGYTPQADVNTVASPSIPANTTNVSLVAWVYPTGLTEVANAGIVMMKTATGTQVDGLCYSSGYGANPIFLDDDWNGGNNNNQTFADPPSNTWSMIAWVITQSNSTLYICDSNVVNNPLVQNISNPYQSWGGPLSIGGWPGGGAASNFNGSISAVAMFTNALTENQVSILYYAGTALDETAPVITTEPASTASYPSRSATFSVSANGITSPEHPSLIYQWYISINGGSTWTALTNGTSTAIQTSYGTVTGATNATLTISATINSFHGALYYVTVSDGIGSPTPSTTATLTIGDILELSAYEQAVTALNPVAFWELNETSGNVAYDYWGGHSGTYGAGVSLYSEPGPDINDDNFPGFTSFTSSPIFTNAIVESNFWPTDTNPNASNNCATTSEVSFGPLNLNTNAVTAVMWIYPNEIQSNVVGLLYCRGSGTIAGFGFYGNNAGDMGYNWGDNGATYGHNPGLVPLVTNWNMVAYVVTPSNISTYCYNSNSVSNTWLANLQTGVTNAVLAWGDPGYIGTDPYDDTGHRQFDGAISEVAVFNQALTREQINGLWDAATSNAVPAILTTKPASGSSFVNLGATITLTAVAANGPLGFTWTAPSEPMPTNGTYAFGEFPGVTFTVNTVGYTSTLTISNALPELTGEEFGVAVTNVAVPTAVAGLGNAGFYVNVFPTPETWTANFSITNGTAWFGAATAVYTGQGAISQGTNWNAIYNAGQLGIGTVGLYTNSTSWDDASNINTGTFLAITNGAGWQCSGGGAYAPLLDWFMRLGTYNTATGTNVYINTIPGYYNLFVYSLNGNCGDRGTIFKIHSSTTATVNGTNNPADTSLLYITNFVIFTNVFASNGIINMSMAANPNAQLGGNTANEIDFNGLQLQLITPYSPLSMTPSGNSLVFTYAGCDLVSATNILGPWTPVVGAPGATNIGTNTFIVTPPSSIPGGKLSAATFYRTVSDSPVSGVPLE